MFTNILARLLGRRPRIRRLGRKNALLVEMVDVYAKFSVVGKYRLSGAYVSEDRLARLTLAPTVRPPGSEPAYLLDLTVQPSMAHATTPVLQQPSHAPRGIAACLAAFAILFGLDALLFRTSLYPSILEPGSSAGQFELTFRRERRAQALN